MSANFINHCEISQLRTNIMSCNLQIGSVAREGTLAEIIRGVKLPIGDALQRLEFEGVVEITPPLSNCIASISVSDAKDILGLRDVLETAAVRRIAAPASDTEFSVLDEFRTCELSGNQRQMNTMRKLTNIFERLRIISLSVGDQEESMQKALNEHSAIIDALQERDGRKAGRLSSRHIQKSHRKVLRELSNRPAVA